jgi:hypothetical protein
LKKEQDRLTKELRGIGAGARSFRQSIRERNRRSKAVQVSSGEDRGRPTSAMGKIQGERGQISRRGSNPGKANALSSGA